MRPVLPLSLLIGSLVVVGVGPSTALAESKSKRKPQRYHVKTEHSDVKAGAARVEVKAPIDVVRKVVTDYGDYSKHIKKFEKAKVIGRRGKKTDVYLQVPIMKGLANVWAIVRFEPVKKTESGEEIIYGRMIKGNVKKLNAWWKLKKLDSGRTLLNLELLIVPDLPVPKSLITGEVAYAADKAVAGLRTRSEQLGRKK